MKLNIQFISYYFVLQNSKHIHKVKSTLNPKDVSPNCFNSSNSQKHQNDISFFLSSYCALPVCDKNAEDPEEGQKNQERKTKAKLWDLKTQLSILE